VGLDGLDQLSGDRILDWALPLVELVETWSCIFVRGSRRARPAAVLISSTCGDRILD